MGITLFDLKSDKIIFDINFWHWRAIVEAVRSLNVLPDSTVNSLHDAYVGELSEADARIVSTALTDRLLPTMNELERLVLNDQMRLATERTTEADDETLYRDNSDQHKNYSTDRDVLTRFAKCCAECGGFRVS